MEISTDATPSQSTGTSAGTSSGTGAGQTYAFQAETQQILDLMIHSLYSHREIFLRELISNASDAIDKLKFEALTQPSLIPDGKEMEIRLSVDSNHHTLTIADTGIGMTKDEVIDHIGTIAKSGTKKWMEIKKEMATQPELIGQFGVGFYSTFMVADRVTLHTQKAGTTNGVLWQSTGNGSYTLQEVPRPQGAGTTITLHLKTPDKSNNETDENTGHESESQDYTDSWTIKSLVKKYSDFINYPIRMKTKRQEPKKNEAGEEVKGETVEVEVDETLNSQKALWARSPSEVKAEEYSEFYKHISHDWSEPLKTIHYKAEGTLEFSALLFIPSQKPWNYNYRDLPYGLQLYVKRVFIMGDCRDLIPEYLRFVKGLVDSSDLSLNVSREILQQDYQVSQMRRSLVTKILNTLKEMNEKTPEDYLKFWKEFGSTLKEGLLSDTANKEKIQDLLLFHSSHSDELTSLKAYVERMKHDQKAIYYITGDALSTLKNSPHLEALKSKGFEVLFLIDPVDEWISERMSEYKGKKLQSVAKDELDLASEEEKKAQESEVQKYQENFKPLIEVMKATLQNRIKDVKISTRLSDSPACLVSGKFDPSARMEKIMESFGQSTGGGAKRILELNPKHPIFEKMAQADRQRQEDWSELIYGQALLAEGSPLPDPVAFSKKISDLMLSLS